MIIHNNLRLNELYFVDENINIINGKVHAYINIVLIGKRNMFRYSTKLTKRK